MHFNARSIAFARHLALAAAAVALGTTACALMGVNAPAPEAETLVLPVTAPLPKLTIDSFTASPASVSLGDSTTLSWSAPDADVFTLTADVGASPGLVTGTSASVSPAATTTYTLVAINATGSVTKTVTVIVTLSTPTPVINAFIATPSVMDNGDTSTLSWSVIDADSLAIVSDAGPSPGPVTGSSVSVSPTASTTYTLIARNAGGSVTRSVTILGRDAVPGSLALNLSAIKVITTP